MSNRGAVIDTKRAVRRDLRFENLDELREDVERLRASHEAGTLTHTGNWNAGQCMWHLGVFMKASLDGFPEQRLPLPLRLLGRYVFKRKVLSGKPAKPGFRLPGSFAWLDPVAQGVETFEEGYGPLKACLDRESAGERFARPSPIFGDLSHDEWCVLHAVHASMHLSFQHPGGVEGVGSGNAS